jgi:flagellar motor switch protein FliN
VPSRLDTESKLSLLTLRQVTGEEMESALAVAMTWSSAFIAECTAQLPGAVVCLFKSEDGAKIDSLAKRPTDGSPKPGARSLLDSVMTETGTRLTTVSMMPVSFGASIHIDLATDETRLKRIIGAEAWIGTFSLSLDDIETQTLLIYAPHGVVGESSSDAAEPIAAEPETTDAKVFSANPSPAPSLSQRTPNRREEPRNIERLLDVELDVVVRFGVTDMPLRDVVRMGVGTMIELNRAVDEPVELLINNRPLARGEVVVVDGYYGVRITEIGTPAERAMSLS